MTPTSQTLQKFTFDGPLPVQWLVVIGALLAVIFAILAWRDARAAGSRKLMFLIFVPRLVALLVVLWMLAGPSTVTLLREFKPKSVVVMVDGSASMGLVDSVDGSGNTLRWNAAQSEGRILPALATLDRAIGNLLAAESDVSQLRQLTKPGIGGTADPQAKVLWDQIHKAIDSAAGDLGNVTLDSARTDPEWSAEPGRVAAFLKESSADSRRTSLPITRQNQNDRLDEMSQILEGGIRRVENLSQKIAARYEHNPLPGEAAPLAAQSKLTRRDKVAAWLNAAEGTWLKDLDARTRVLRYEFATSVVPVADRDWRQVLLRQTNDDMGGTDLGAALNRAAQDAGQQTVDAVLMITDGGHNLPGDPRELATSLRGVPLLIVPIGSLETPRDVILHHAQCPRAVFVNDLVLVDAMVTAYGCEGELLQIDLLSDDKVVDHQTLTASSRVFDGRINFRWKAAELGRHVLKIRIAPLPREQSLDNNAAQVEVEVMEDTIRVLVADDLPRWEYRYLINLFKRDKHIDFEQLLFEPHDDAQAGAAALSFPRDLEAWRRYRVVILGDVSPAQLPPAQQEMLRKFVSEDGGNLIVVAGETAMPQAFAGQPLGGMIPSVAEPLDPQQGLGLVVTAEGSVAVPTQVDDDPLASDRVWREMSARLPVYNLSPISRPKPTSHVLIAAAAPGQTAELRAFLSWEYVGLGRVVYVAAPVTYELRYGKGDLYHHRFWGQLLRWVIAREMSGGSKTVHLLTDKNSYEAGDRAQIVLRLSHLDGADAAGGQCGVEALKDGRVIKQIAMREDPALPGAYRGSFDDLPAGPLLLRAAGATVEALLLEEKRREPVTQMVDVDPKGSTEMSNPLCNLSLLNQIADASGGAVVPPAAVQNALANLDLKPDSQDTVTSRQPVWDRWDLLWIFLGCLTIEWLARRYWRMI